MTALDKAGWVVAAAGVLVTVAGIVRLKQDRVELGVQLIILSAWVMLAGFVLAQQWFIATVVGTTAVLLTARWWFGGRRG